jgi:hypothetical protein
MPFGINICHSSPTGNSSPIQPSPLGSQRLPWFTKTTEDNDADTTKDN